MREASLRGRSVDVVLSSGERDEGVAAEAGRRALVGVAGMASRGRHASAMLGRLAMVVQLAIDKA